MQRCFPELCKVSAYSLLITILHAQFLSSLRSGVFFLQICDGDVPYRTLDDLTAGHKKFREEAVNLFKKKNKMGGDNMSSQYLVDLENETEVKH